MRINSVNIAFQCVASNLIGFFLYIAAGSMVVWEYSWVVEEDYEGDDRNYRIGK